MSKEEYERFLKEITELNEELYKKTPDGPFSNELYNKYRKIADELLQTKKLTLEEFHKLGAKLPKLIKEPPIFPPDY